MTLGVHITSTDPLDYADPGVIELVSIKPSTPRSYAEAINSEGKALAAALQILKPLEQWDLVYRLHDTAALDVMFGVAVNTSYLVMAASLSCSPDKQPLLTITAIKPSNAAMIKANGTGFTFSVVGGFGIVNKHGATSTASFISSQASVSVQMLEAMHETTGDFETDGIYQFVPKLEAQVTAYAAITTPVGAHATPNAPTTPTETEDGWQVFEASFWTYLDPA